MNKKDENGFFSTEDEYNKRLSSQDNADDPELGDYSKYLTDYDDVEEITENTADVQPAEDEYFDSQKKANDLKSGNSDKKRRNKIIVRVLIIILVCIIVFTGASVFYIYYITKDARYNDNGVEYNDENQYLEEDDHDFAAMGDVTDADSLNSYLKNWATNGGENMYSKNVINVLLCGVDDSDPGTMGRSDSIILVSVNKKTKSITLSSFFRDSYTYMEIPQKDGTTKSRYEKINASYVFGGPAALIDTLEKNFKINIDQYISVDFASFKNLIDAIGGVTVDVQEHEAMFIRRTSRYKNFPYGKQVKLNGSQALVYARIRKLDTDINRTERQRKIIKSLIESAKTASLGQLKNAYKNCAKYIRTGYSQTKVIKLINEAVTQDWMDYTINELTFPSEEGVEMVSTYLNTTSSPRAKAWVWIVDFPICAQKLQLAIYGETNIVLKADRISALDYTNAKKINSNDNNGSSGTGKTYSYNTTRSTTYKAYSSKNAWSAPTSSSSVYTGNNDQTSAPADQGGNDNTAPPVQTDPPPAETPDVQDGGND